MSDVKLINYNSKNTSENNLIDIIAGILAMLAFFVVGGALLCFVNTEKGVTDAKRITDKKSSA